MESLLDISIRTYHSKVAYHLASGWQSQFCLTRKRLPFCLLGTYEGSDIVHPPILPFLEGPPRWIVVALRYQRCFRPRLSSTLVD
jgi:hypothetical protein